MRHYHEESFNFEELTASVATAAPVVSGVGFSVELTKSGVTISCAADQFVLDATKIAGLRLPFACSQGLCGTCKSTLISGKVDMQHNGGIRPREIAQGLFLPCCSKPLTDLVVER